MNHGGGSVGKGPLALCLCVVVALVVWLSFSFAVLGRLQSGGSGGDGGSPEVVPVREEHQARREMPIEGGRMGGIPPEVRAAMAAAEKAAEPTAPLTRPMYDPTDDDYRALLSDADIARVEGVVSSRNTRVRAPEPVPDGDAVDLSNPATYLLFFLHIPKSAGQAFSSVLRTVLAQPRGFTLPYPPDASLSADPDAATALLNRMSAISKKQRAGPTFASGRNRTVTSGASAKEEMLSALRRRVSDLQRTVEIREGEVKRVQAELSAVGGDETRRIMLQRSLNRADLDLRRARSRLYDAVQRETRVAASNSTDIGTQPLTTATGGKAFRFDINFAQNYPSFYMKDHQPDMLPAKFRSGTLGIGHCDVTIARALAPRPVRFMTFLRDPVHRMASLYHYLVTRIYPVMGQAAKAAKLFDELQRDLSPSEFSALFPPKAQRALPGAANRDCSWWCENVNLTFPSWTQNTSYPDFLATLPLDRQDNYATRAFAGLLTPSFRTRDPLATRAAADSLTADCWPNADAPDTTDLNTPAARARALACAKDFLDASPFIGIQEWYEESIDLFRYTFNLAHAGVGGGADAVPQVGRDKELVSRLKQLAGVPAPPAPKPMVRNKTPKYPEAVAYSSSVVAAIRSMESLDFEIYAYGREIFKLRYAKCMEAGKCRTPLSKEK